MSLDTQYEELFGEDPEEPKISSFEYNLLFEAHLALIEECIKSKKYSIKLAKGEEPEWSTNDRVAHANQKIRGYNQQIQSLKKARQRAYGR